MTQDHTFGVTGCTGGIQNTGNVTAAARLYFCREEIPVTGVELLATLLHSFEIHQKILLITPHASSVTVNNVFKFRTSVLDFKQLIDLFLVFCNSETNLSVFDYKL